MVLVDQRNIIVKQYVDLAPSLSARVMGSTTNISSLVINNLTDRTISWHIVNQLDNIIIVQFNPCRFPQLKLRGESVIGSDYTTTFDYEIGDRPHGLSRVYSGLSEKLDTKHYFYTKGKTIPEIVVRIKYFDSHRLVA